MKKFKAIFFDRDGTLSKPNLKLTFERDRELGEFIGKNDFAITSEYFMKIFDMVLKVHPELDPVDSLEKEDLFWKRWYQLILKENNVLDKNLQLSTMLYDKYCYYKIKEPYPETIEVLEYVKSKGYKIGIISDTFPSLENSLRYIGLSKYIDSYTSSALVGAMKPDLRIFKAALDSLNVSAEDSFYIDDYKPEADGAREVGFTSFHLDRSKKTYDVSTWTMTNLKNIIDYLENA